MAPFLALITPVGETGGGQPPGIWGPNDPRPTPPIAGPGRPPWWGIANDPGYSPPWARPPVDPGYSPPWAQVPPGTRPPTGPVDPGYSPPWAQVPPGGQGGGPVDPGYSPPWAQVRPPVDPGYSPPWAQVPPGGQGGGPVDPGYSPPWAQVPGGGRPPGPPNLPEGGGVIVPLPEGANAPPAPEGTPENHSPYVVWFGPGTVVSVVYLPPPATTKPPVPGERPPE
jgi:hypothetical protein